MGMSDAPDEGESQPVGASAHWFWVQAIIATTGLTYLILWQGLVLFNAVAAYLPLLLPLAVTVLSVLPRATELKTYDSVLKVSNDVAIGIISFDIWALSASRSDPEGRILVNSTTMIRGEFVLPFLLAGFFIALSCAVLTNFANSFKSSQIRQRSLLVALIASILVYLLPFGVIEPIPTPSAPAQTAAVNNFSVVIPYRDPTITGVAPAYLADKYLLRVEPNVRATDHSDARAKGVQQFLESSDAVQAKNRRERVVVDYAQVVVCAVDQ